MSTAVFARFLLVFLHKQSLKPPRLEDRFPVGEAAKFLFEDCQVGRNDPAEEPQPFAPS